VTIPQQNNRKFGVLLLKGINQERSTCQSFHKPHSILTRSNFPALQVSNATLVWHANYSSGICIKGGEVETPAGLNHSLVMLQTN